jgi:glutamate racemase
MVKIEADRLANRKVLVIGTEFTASQRLYPDILSAAVPGIRTDTVAATELERKIARFQTWDGAQDTALTNDLGRAIGNTDIAVLACTCFPMIAAELESLFPTVTFLDPGAYCSGLLNENAIAQHRNLHIKVTGKVVSTAQATDLARSYLGHGTVDS